MTAEELKLRSEKSPLAFESPARGLRKNSARLAGFFSATILLAACFCFPLYKFDLSGS